MNQAVREKRLAYLALADEGCCLLCSFCKFGVSEGGSVCDGDGYTVCEHKLSDRLDFLHGGYGMEPGIDCWAFRPSEPIEVVADIVGLLLGSAGHGASWTKREDGTYAVYVVKE
jgi:hypothetical protein